MIRSPTRRDEEVGRRRLVESSQQKSVGRRRLAEKSSQLSISPTVVGDRHGVGEEMSRRTEKTVITVKTFQRTVVRLRQKENIAWCEQCAAETVMFAPNEAAAYLQTTAREIFRRVEAGEMHYLETETGALLICRNSL